MHCCTHTQLVSEQKVCLEAWNYWKLPLLGDYVWLLAKLQMWHAISGIDCCRVPYATGSMRAGLL
jgi:hypothetical protein